MNFINKKLNGEIIYIIFICYSWREITVKCEMINNGKVFLFTSCFGMLTEAVLISQDC